MKIALLADIHSNHIALKAVLEDLERKKIDKTIFLGDYIFNGYGSCQVVDMIIDYEQVRSGSCHIISGNIEAIIEPLEKGADWIYPINKQIYSELGDKRIEFIKSLSDSMVLNVVGKSIRICHSPSDIEIIKIDDDIKRESCRIIKDNLEEIADLMQEDICIFGHYHVYIDEVVNGVRFICPSSVGMPFNGDNRAQYVILNISDEVVVEKCFVKYNHYDIVRCFESSGYLNSFYLRSSNTLMTYMTGHNYMNQ